MPRISIVVPVYRPARVYLEEMVASVRAQTFTDWELICVDDGSDSADVIEVLTLASEADPRIRMVARTNGGIVAATNTGLHRATGEFVGLLDHDDLLEPTAVAAVMAVLDGPGGADVDLIYTDELIVDEKGHRSGEMRKPDFSPERLRGQMYINHFSVYRRSLLDEIGGLRDGFDGSQDYDLALRATEKARRVVHIPELLYRWRIHDASVSHRADNAPVFAAARRALTEHLSRTGIDAEVEQIAATGVYRIRRRLTDTPLISIVIPTRGSSAKVFGEMRCMVTGAVKSILEQSTYEHIEFVVVIDAVASDAVRQELLELGGGRMKLVTWTAPFNFAAKVNRGVAHATGEYVLLLNDDVEVITPDWLEAMLGLCRQPDVGMVGPMLYFEDGTIQHGGHLYAGGGAGHIAFGESRGAVGPFSTYTLDREVSGVTAACALMRTDVYYEAGGMFTGLPGNYNDVDLCMKVGALGYRIVWTPFAELFHFESKTRKPQLTAYELATIRSRWGHRFDNDPMWPYHGLPPGPARWF